MFMCILHIWTIAIYNIKKILLQFILINIIINQEFKINFPFKKKILSLKNKLLQHLYKNYIAYIPNKNNILLKLLEIKY